MTETRCISDPVKRLEQYHAALLEVCDSHLYLSGSVGSKIEMLLKLASSLLDAKRVSAWEYNAERTKIVCRYLFNQDTGEIESGMALSIEDFPQYFAAMASNRVIVANSARLHPATTEFTEKYLIPMGIYSMLDTPVYSSDSQHGVLCVEDSHKNRTWTVDEVSFVIAIADKISLALENRAWQRASEQLDQAQRVDPLTGLENRIAFQDRLDTACYDGEVSFTSSAILVIGLDRFKDINDAVGYNQANEVLKAFAKTLVDLRTSSSTFIARISGDVFAVWLSKMDSPLKHVISTVMDAIKKQSVPLASGNLEYSASMGVVEISSLTNSAENLVRKAEIALSKAKALGVGSCAVYDSSWLSEFRSRKDSESDLLNAISKEELVPYYQPIIDCESGTVSGLEALIRWNHPTRGVLSPAYFLPLATEMRIMPQLGELMLSQVLKDISLHDPLKNLSWVSVNLSAEQLYSNTLAQVIPSLLERYAPPEGILELEIVEELISYDTKQVVSQLNALAKYGVRFSIDDFGTGYSSLARLKHLPVSKLKIDRSFVDGLPSDESDRCIASSIIGMAKGLDLRIVAEGVESLEQANWLKQSGCDFIQGFYYSKPMAIDEILSFLSSSP